jgi:CRISPR-associated protein Cas2
MSSRRQYLVSYDIADDKRRRNIFEFLRGQGDHAQYSVFFCQWSERELVDARSEMRELIHQREDQVLIVDLGRKPPRSGDLPRSSGETLRGQRPRLRRIVPATGCSLTTRFSWSRPAVARAPREPLPSGNPGRRANPLANQ